MFKREREGASVSGEYVKNHPERIAEIRRIGEDVLVTKAVSNFGWRGFADIEIRVRG